MGNGICNKSFFNGGRAYEGFDAVRDFIAGAEFRFAPDRGILERLAEMSAPYGTKIRVRDDGLGVVEREE